MYFAVIEIIIWVYVAIGAVLAVPLSVWGTGRIDPSAKQATWGFRVMIIPSLIFLWPILLIRLAQSQTHPPEESNPHRDLTRNQP